MKQVLLIIVSLFVLLTAPAIGFAETTSPASPSVQDRIAQETKGFDPEQVGQQMEAKAGEVMDMAKGASFLYMAFALFAFLLLLLVGLLYRPFLKVAFLILILAVFGFLLVQNWESVLGGFKSFFRWLGSEAKPTAPSQEGAAPQGNPI